MYIQSKSVLTSLLILIFGFMTGVAFQKFITMDALLRIFGLRNEITYQLNGRKPVPISRSTMSNAMVALAFGQSNSANYGKGRHTSDQGTYNFFDGKLYPARDPMIGASGMGGSVWTRLGDRLVEESVYDTVVFSTLGVGNSDIARWTPGGDLHPRLIEAIDDITDSGLRITHLLWHQGETDARLRTSAEEYRRLFIAMLDSLRRHGVDAQIYVSIATRCYENDGVASLRRVQRQLVNPDAGILPGPDTDVLGPEHRYDKCHFSEKGLMAAANLWFEALIAGRNRKFR